MTALLRRFYASLYVKLCTYQEGKMPSMSTYHLADDATENELQEMAAERRQLAMEQRERATTITSHPLGIGRGAVAYARIWPDNEHDAQALRDFDAWSGYGSDIAELNN